MPYTGCVICLGTEFQMGVTQKWLEPGSQKFYQLLKIVFGSFFEIFEILALKNLHL